MPAAPAQHVRDLVLVDTGQRDHVDLDRQPGPGRRVDPAQHGGQVAPARDMGEPAGSQAVEAHVDPPHARRVETGGEMLEPGRVGGQGQLVEPGADARADGCGKVEHAAPDQRFAPGQADLAHSARDEDVGQRGDFFERENFAPRKELHPLGHAIPAAQVAAIGDRDADVADGAVEAVDQPGLVVRWPFNRHHFVRTSPQELLPT